MAQRRKQREISVGRLFIFALVVFIPMSLIILYQNFTPSEPSSITPSACIPGKIVCGEAPNSTYKCTIVQDAAAVGSQKASAVADYTYKNQYKLTIPPSCSHITLKAWGGGGAGSAYILSGAVKSSATGGGGAFVKATVKNDRKNASGAPVNSIAIWIPKGDARNWNYGWARWSDFTGYTAPLTSYILGVGGGGGAGGGGFYTDDGVKKYNSGGNGGGAGSKGSSVTNNRGLTATGGGGASSGGPGNPGTWGGDGDPNPPLCASKPGGSTPPGSMGGGHGCMDQNWGASGGHGGSGWYGGGIGGQTSTAIGSNSAGGGGGGSYISSDSVGSIANGGSPKPGGTGDGDWANSAGEGGKVSGSTLLKGRPGRFVVSFYSVETDDPTFNSTDPKYGYFLWTTSSYAQIWAVDKTDGASTKQPLNIKTHDHLGTGWVATDLQHFSDGSLRLLWSQKSKGKAEVWKLEPHTFAPMAETIAYTGELGETAESYHESDGEGRIVMYNSKLRRHTIVRLNSSGQFVSKVSYAAPKTGTSPDFQWASPVRYFVDPATATRHLVWAFGPNSSQTNPPHPAGYLWSLANATEKKASTVNFEYPADAGNEVVRDYHSNPSGSRVLWADDAATTPYARACTTASECFRVEFPGAAGWRSRAYAE